MRVVEALLYDVPTIVEEASRTRMFEEWIVDTYEHAVSLGHMPGEVVYCLCSLPLLVTTRRYPRYVLYTERVIGEEKPITRIELLPIYRQGSDYILIVTKPLAETCLAYPHAVTYLTCLAIVRAGLIIAGGDRVLEQDLAETCLEPYRMCSRLLTASYVETCLALRALEQEMEKKRPKIYPIDRLDTLITALLEGGRYVTPNGNVSPSPTQVEKARKVIEVIIGKLREYAPEACEAVERILQG